MANLREELAAALPGLQKAVFSQPADKRSDQKVTVRPVRIKGKPSYQVERFRDNKAFHQNLDDTALLSLVDNELEGRYRQVLIVGERESAQYVLRQKGGYKKTGRSAALPRPGGDQAHNREKEYLLREGENIPALVDLGVFTPDFKIVRSKYDKYKQINRFVELVDQELGRYEGREIRILDFGCGKSYLTFAMYYYLKTVKAYDVDIIGLDLKTDVIAKCNALRDKYGYDGLKFFQGDIKDYEGAESVDMVVTLHACDTATDYALHKAVLWDASVILSVPCCQHEMNRQLNCKPLEDLFAYGLIRERTAALFTDAIRAQIMETQGYDVQILEFIDMEHTPKNIMLRCVRRKVDKREEQEEKYRREKREKLMELSEFLGVQPKLMTLLQE